MTIRDSGRLRQSFEFFKKSPYAMPCDVHLCDQSTLLGIMARFQEDVYGSLDSAGNSEKSPNSDLKALAFQYDGELLEWMGRSDVHRAGEQSCVHTDTLTPL